jgi:putative restriction endonuclease
MTVRKPPNQKYTKNQLVDFVIEAIQDSGYRVLFVSSSNVHPFKLRIYNETENFLIKVYIWNLSHGGGVKRPRNEYRIQISGVDVFREEPGYSTLILGYWAEVEVFAGMEKFIQNLRPLINLPPAKNDRPNINYIIKANEIRGWNIK